MHSGDLPVQRGDKLRLSQIIRNSKCGRNRPQLSLREEHSPAALH